MGSLAFISKNKTLVCLFGRWIAASPQEQKKKKTVKKQTNITNNKTGRVISYWYSEFSEPWGSIPAALRRVM